MGWHSKMYASKVRYKNEGKYTKLYPLLLI